MAARHLDVVDDDAADPLRASRPAPSLYVQRCHAAARYVNQRDYAKARAAATGQSARLPLAKDLAAVLGVNKNIVLRALHLLRDEGLLEFRRGRGITVAGTPT
jgi:Bacterial regulatory proteins, gntR family